MQIPGNKPAPEGDNRRFTVGKAPPKEGAKSFSAALKQARSANAPAPTGAAPPAPRPAVPAGTAPSESPAPPPPPAAGNAPAEGSAAPAGSAGAEPGATQAGSGPGRTRGAGKAGTEDSFADHMETVRFRLRTGYYSSKAIEDALTEKLSGYFDELA